MCLPLFRCENATCNESFTYFHSGPPVRTHRGNTIGNRIVPAILGVVSHSHRTWNLISPSCQWKQGSSSSSSGGKPRGRGSRGAAASVATSSTASTSSPSTMSKAMAAAVEMQNMKGPLKLMAKAATVDYGKNRPVSPPSIFRAASHRCQAIFGVDGC